MAKNPKNSDPVRIDPQSAEPVYQQLARLLRQEILLGRLAAGSKLSERWIAQEYDVTRTTVRSTLHVLTAQGLIRRAPRKGTVVADVKAGEPRFSTMPVILAREGRYHWMPGEPPRDNWFVRIYSGIQSMAQDMGYDLRKEVLGNPSRVPLDKYVPPRPSEVGGVVLYGTYDEQYIEMFRSEHVPLVTVDYWTHDLTTDCVTVDVEDEAYAIVDFLTERGHTSLGFMAMGRRIPYGTVLAHEYDPDIQRMLASLRQAVQRRRMEFRNEWVLLVPSSAYSLEQAATGYLSMQPRPTAILTFSPDCGAAILATASRIGLKCPEDFSLITRGAETISDQTPTRIVSDPALMGRMAVKLLSERMHGLRTQPVKLALPPRLVVGTTTGPAPRPTP
jgi:DNA-binding LacI/PurR family transcriptional regulator/DNA-binding transcriptional regulator YhcF (GntR family)